MPDDKENTPQTYAAKTESRVQTTYPKPPRIKWTRKKKIYTIIGVILFFMVRHCGGCHGPYVGIVLSGENYLPIRNAQVRATVYYNTPFETPLSVKSSYSSTNFLGLYLVPGVYQLGGMFFQNLYFVVYKSGYVAYMNDSAFRGPERAFFNPIFNVVVLKKWDESKFTLKDHDDHMSMIGCDSIIGRDDMKKLQKFCRGARDEMILACDNYNPENPTPHDICVEEVDEELGLKGKK